MAKLRHFSATAVAEGVRLEVGKYTVFAVRNAQKDISVRMRREPRKFLRACMAIPFVRGIARLIRDVLRFFDGLSESAELDPQHPVRGNCVERFIARILHIYPQTIVTLVSAIMILPVALICLYAAPAGAALLFESLFMPSRLALNLLVALVRIMGVLLSVAALCRLRVFKRLSMYKGAINKVINCYECRDEVSVENIATYPILTRRSEPAFVLCVLCISLLLFPLIRPMNFLFTALLRVAILLGVAALFDEPFLALEEARMTKGVWIARAPIDFIQHMTTLEPHPQMLEVAVCAFEAAMGKSQDELEAEVTEVDDLGVDVACD